LSGHEIVSKAREAELESRLIMVIHAYDELKVKLAQLEGENHAYRVQAVQLKGQIMTERAKRDALKNKCEDQQSQIRSLKAMLALRQDS
jgi:hypothetical protein